jgi:hypothetical protein
LELIWASVYAIYLRRGNIPVKSPSPR